MDKAIAMLWMRGRLSFVEQLCIRSFQDAGHHVVLYSYEELGAVPDGVFGTGPAEKKIVNPVQCRQQNHLGLEESPVLSGKIEGSTGVAAVDDDQSHVRDPSLLTSPGL